MIKSTKGVKLVKVLMLILAVFVTFGLASCDETSNEGGIEDDNNQNINMAQSYSTARSQFKAVTGIEVPALENLEADDGYFQYYNQGDTEYCFDIIGGSALNFETYMTIERFFMVKLGNCSAGYPIGDEQSGRDAQWIKNGRWFQTMWDAHNRAIYINTTLRAGGDDTNVDMTESYRQGREAIYSLTGIYLPELENITLLASSDLSPQNGVVCFDIPGDRDLYTTLYNFLKEKIYQITDFSKEDENCDEDDDYANWRFIINVNGQKSLIWVGIMIDQIGLDRSAIYINVTLSSYYTITLRSGEGGSVTMQKGNNALPNNTVEAFYGDNLTFVATPDNNYDFIGWFVNGVKIDDNNPYIYEVEKNSATIIAVFEEKSNMTEEYLAFKSTLYGLSGVQLPDIEGVSINNEVIVKDDENHIRDEIQGELVFGADANAYLVAQSIKDIMVRTLGNPTIIKENNLGLSCQWSKLNLSATKPYREEAMLNCVKNGTSIFVMWRKQPIVIINVASEGQGEAHGIYYDMVDGAISEKTYTKYWEIVDAFHGTLLATPNEGNQFDGWFVNDVSVSNEARFNFNYEDVDFVEITFVAKFSELEPAMTDSYSNGRDDFYAISGIMLPEIADLELDNSSTFNAEDKTAQFVVAGTSELFTTFLNCVKGALADNALANNENHWEEADIGAFWEWDFTDNAGSKHKVTIMVQLGNDKVSVGYWFRDFYSLSLNAGENGSATLKCSGRVMQDNTIYAVKGTNVQLYATANNGFEFSGFYINNEFYSVEQGVYYEMKSNVIIEARFTVKQIEMTQTYITARQALNGVVGVMLPELEVVTVDDLTIENNSVQFNITNADETAYTTINDSIIEQVHKKSSFRAYGESAYEANISGIWSFNVLENGKTNRKYLIIFFDANTNSISVEASSTLLYNVTLTTRMNGVVSMKENDNTIQSVNVYVPANTQLTFTAVANNGYEFTGWYVDTQLLSTQNPYYYTVSKDITILGKFEEKQAQMTESYIEARNSLQNVSGILLPEIVEVTAMFEVLSEVGYMIDISGADNDAFIMVKRAFNDQTGVDSYLNGYGVDVWDFTLVNNGSTYVCKLSCFIDSGIIVIMLNKEEVAQSYITCRQNFQNATGVLLPLIAGLEPDMEAPDYIFDIFDGDNINEDTFKIFKDFFDGLEGWEYSGVNVASGNEEYYATYTYQSNGMSIQLVLSKAGEAGEVNGIFINAFTK